MTNVDPEILANTTDLLAGLRIASRIPLLNVMTTLIEEIPESPIVAIGDLTYGVETVLYGKEVWISKKLDASVTESTLITLSHQIPAPLEGRGVYASRIIRSDSGTVIARGDYCSWNPLRNTLGSLRLVSSLHTVKRWALL